MLTLNFSDKGTKPQDQEPSVTGRFGLGFKSVFFACDCPEVISGRLSFAITGGFFPTRLDPTSADQLRQWAKGNLSSGLQPTVFQLSMKDAEARKKISASIALLHTQAPLLLSFARGVRKIVIHDSDGKRIYERQEEGILPTGELSIIKVGDTSIMSFNCRVAGEQTPARIAFQFYSTGIVDLSEDLPRLWITTPTSEKSNFGWVLNAPFKPDAGRQQLARGNPENHCIADQIANGWGNALIKLFDQSKSDWQLFASGLTLSAAVTNAEFWARFWDSATRANPILEWNAMQHGGDVLAYIAWGKSFGAWRKFIQERECIPTKLPEPYSASVRISSIRSYTSGILNPSDKPGADVCFKEVCTWESFQSAYPFTSIVRQDVRSFLQKADCLNEEVKEITLQEAVLSELGTGRRADTSQAERIGRLFERCSFMFNEDNPYWPEAHRLLDSLKRIEFNSDNNTYHPVNELVCGNKYQNLIDDDELLRAAFAPPNALLSPDYNEPARLFFIKARGKLNASANQLADWARRASDEKLPAIFKYLISGNLNQQLADQLRRTWLDNQRKKPPFTSLTEEDKSEVERLFFKGQT